MKRIGTALMLTTALVTIDGGHLSPAWATSSKAPPMEAPHDPTERFKTPEFKAGPALDQIGAPAAYVKGATGRGQVVAVVDEDFDLDHPDLEPNIRAFADITNGRRAGQDDADNSDERRELDQLEAIAETVLPAGHGTQVAGVIGAARNGEGLHGVAPDVTLIPIRAEIFNFEPIASSDDLIQALDGGASTFFVRKENPDGPDDIDVIQLEEDDSEEELQAKFAQINASINDDRFDVATGEGGGFDNDDVARAIDVATLLGADIINLSLGGPPEPDEDLDETVAPLERATGNGVIIVASTGNDGGDQPELPARFASDPRTHGLMIAVGAVDADNEIADFSNRCGSAKDQCLVAPGVDVSTTDNGGGVTQATGTSFSTPIVSGSLALLKDLFPTISSRDAVKILLISATDLGEEGVDEVYGRGLVNLERAVQPIGVASLPTGKHVSGDVATLARSTLGLSGAFGDAFADIGALKNGLFVDQFRRPYQANLQSRVSSGKRGIDFEKALASSDIEQHRFASQGGAQVTLALRADQDRAFETPGGRTDFARDAYGRDEQLQSLRFDAELGNGLTVKAGHNLTAGQQLEATPAASAGHGMFLFADESLSPQHAFLGKGSGASFKQQIGEGTKLSVGFLASGDQIGDRPGEGTAMQAGVEHRFDGGARLGFSFSFTNEGEGFLGSQASGAFADRAETDSQFYTLSGSAPIAENWQAFGSVTLGVSDLSDVNGSLLSGLDRTVSDSFALGVTKQAIFDDKDRMGMMLSQSLRVEGGSATISAPTAVNLDGSIVRQSEKVGLEPSGRELNLQLAYSRDLSSSVDMTTYALARTEPGHDADASPDVGIGMHLRWTF